MVQKKLAATVLCLGWAALIVACGGGIDRPPDAARAPEGGIDPTRTTPYPTSPKKLAKPKDWVTIATWSGAGAKTTERFRSESGELAVSWTARPSSDAARFGIAGVFQIYVHGRDPLDLHVAANQSAHAQESDVSYVHSRAGTYYLDINAANCSWAVEVKDWRTIEEASSETKESSPPSSPPDTSGGVDIPAKPAENTEEPEKPETPDPAELEKLAQGKLRLADELLERGKRSSAKRWYEEIVRDYPLTKTADEAYRKLEAMR